MDKSPQNVHLKLYFEKKEIRRLTIPRPESFFAFQQTLSKVYPQLYHPELLVRYVDEDQELVRIGSQLEWEEYLKFSANENLLRLHIGEAKPQGYYFKDGPAAPVAASFYEQDKDNKSTKPVSSSPQLTGNVMQVLSSFFPNGRILPFNMPDWLAKVVKVENIGNNEVDLDVDIPAFLSLLHSRALSLIPDNNEEALALLSQLLQIDASDAVVLYNYACSLCHAGKIEEAYEAMQKAIRQGYSDIPHTIQDPDLAPLREKATEKFQNLIRMMLAQKQVHSTEKERQEKEKQEKEKQEKEKQEKERLEKERLEKERLEKERLEKEKQEKERLEKERLEKERQEKEQEKKRFMELQNNKEFKRLFMEYSSQLSMVKETGFKYDDEVILQIISQYKGDVTKTIAHLLDL